MDGANVGIIDKGVAEHCEEGKFPDMVEKGGAVEEPKVYDKDFMQKTRYKVSFLKTFTKPPCDNMSGHGTKKKCIG